MRKKLLVRPAHLAGALDDESCGASPQTYPDALFVEMGPGTVLSTARRRRIVPGAQTMTCGTAAEVEQLIGALPA